MLALRKCNKRAMRNPLHAFIPVRRNRNEKMARRTYQARDTPEAGIKLRKERREARNSNLNLKTAVEPPIDADERR